MNGPSAANPPAPRRAYLDNLKTFLVAGVITGHVLITYADIGSWAYREPSTNKAFIIPAAFYVAVGSMFAMGLFFLIAGLLVPRALARKGPAGFLRDRLVRLGPPFLAFLLVVFPVVRWMGDGRGRSLAWFFRDQLKELDPGPLWFVLALLIFSAGYAACRVVRPARTSPRPWRASLLFGLAAGIAAATFAVRLRFPIDSHQIFVLHVWQWPQCVGLFALGIACAENGWLDPVPDRLRRWAGGTALSGAGMIVAAILLNMKNTDPLGGGMNWPAAVIAAGEGITATGSSVWLLGLFQRRFDGAGPLARALGRAAFGAYVVQAPVAVAIARLAQPLPVAPELKFLFVAPAAVAGSFGLAWLLTKVPGVKKFI
ncbi:MAG: acyltransferase [Candidatus Aminicenantes bacterium]|nr:acyltransferase [Candidatus Aminicenantes bacterium]NLH76019.1 acyltransferase [Acidobacteriota bacterium]